MTIIFLLTIFVSFTGNCIAQDKDDEKLSKQVLELGDELYFACLKEAEYINDALEKNQSVANVPNRDIRDEDVIFWLYTRKNPKVPQNLSASNPKALAASNFDTSKLVVFYIPGARDAALESAIQLSSKILPSLDVNVIVTNWDSYSFFNGSFVVNRTVPLLAKICIKLIDQLIDAGAKAQQIYLIGFSAGGQTAGFIGKGVRNLGRILGIDPGARCYTYQPPTMKLTEKDALSVQFLHCSGGVLGAPPNYTVGADFFYYGGVFQPTCRYEDSPYQTGVCSHILCKYYFFDSLTNFNISFGVKCNSYDVYEKQNCASKETEIAGFYSKSTVRGSYFIEKYPYQASNKLDLNEWF